MKTLSLEQMETVEGGTTDPKCQAFTGAMCTATVILAFSTIFAPLAGATGVVCIAGLADGCGLS